MRNINQDSTKDNKRNSYMIMFCYLCMIIGFVMTIYSTYLFVSGYFTFDYGHNLNSLSKTSGTEWGDMALNGDIKTPFELIQMGGTRLFKGYALGLIGMFLFVYYSVILFMVSLDKNDKFLERRKKSKNIK